MLDLPSAKFVNPWNWHFLHCCKLRISKCIFPSWERRLNTRLGTVIVCFGQSSLCAQYYETRMSYRFTDFTSLCSFCRGGLTLSSLTDCWYCFGPIKIITGVCGAVSQYHFHSRLWLGFLLMYLKKLYHFNIDHRRYKAAC